MKQNKRLFNSLLYTYKKSKRKLANLQQEGRNLRRQSILQKRVEKLYAQLMSLWLTIKKASVVGVMAATTLAFNTSNANAQTFAAYTINPFSLSGTGGGQSSPSFFDLDNDGDLDVIKDNGGSGDFYYFENTGTANAPAFGAAQMNPFGLTNVGSWAAIHFVDLDNDGDADVMVFESASTWEYFENIGTPSAPSYAPFTTNPFGLGVTYQYNYSSFDFEDLDNDGDLDLLAGDYYGDFTYYENTGSPSAPAFAAGITNPFGLTSISDYYATPSFVDMDNDGDFDLMVGSQYTDFYYFENTGTNIAPAFAAAIQNPFSLTNLSNATGYYSSPTFVDIDGDGDLDMFSNNDYYGDFYFFENTSPPTCTISDQTVSATQNSACDSLSTTINIAATDTNVVYFLRNNTNDSIVDGPLVGTGIGLSFNTGTINNTTTYNVYATKPSGGLAFDGVNDVINLPNAISNNINNNITIEGWFNLRGLSSVMNEALISEAFVGDNNVKFTIFNNAGASIQAGFFDGVWHRATAPLPPLNQWVHIAATYDQQSINIYYNGTLVGSLAVTNALPNSSSEPWYIGKRWDFNEYTDMIADEVRIWNVTKTANELQTDMHNCLSGTETGLVAYYQFEDGSGSSSLTDVTTGNFNGTLSNIDVNNAWIEGSIVCSSCDKEMNDTVTITINTGQPILMNSFTQDTICDDGGPVALPAATPSGGIYSGNGVVGNMFDPSVSGTGTHTILYTYTDSNSCSSSDSAMITVQTCVGVNEASLSNKLNLYPNPTNGMVTINMGNSNLNANITITSYDGKVVSSLNNVNSNTVNVNLNDVANGIYFVTISNTNFNKTIKLIKN